ncbi:MAG: hypothetical protein HQL24_02660 [Candidatus Omnitrophica bacterium]|nr:hypothetical protein [Candidatus Omnitrophota bacterium]
MTKEKKIEQDAVANILKSISYQTGSFFGKITSLGKNAKTSLADMKESFDEGVQSLAEEEMDPAPVNVEVKEAKEKKVRKGKRAKKEQESLKEEKVEAEEKKTESADVEEKSEKAPSKKRATKRK